MNDVGFFHFGFRVVLSETKDLLRKHMMSSLNKRSFHFVHDDNVATVIARNEVSKQSLT